MSSESRTESGRRTATISLAASLAAAALLVGCGTMDFRAGEEFDATRLKLDLQPGLSTGTQVEAVLGAPFGTGRAMMPYHDAPRTVWTYYSESGSVDLGSGALQDQRSYLFVFLVDDVFEGYMWFDSRLE